jgi:hypothetical protein
MRKMRLGMAKKTLKVVVLANVLVEMKVRVSLKV